MNVNEVLQFVDRLVIEKTGKHLDYIQKAIIEGTWEKQTYEEIAEQCDVTEGHVGDVGSELWKFLSSILGEDIRKQTFRSSFENLHIDSFYVVMNTNNNKNNNNNYFCDSQNLPNSHRKKKQKNREKPKTAYHDLLLAPRISKFYNREKELTTLNNWIFRENCPFICILGLSGIGKSYLIRQFINLNLGKFDVILWRSLKFPQSLDELIHDLLTITQKGQKQLDLNPVNKLKQLFNLLTEKKYLIILDDVENLFKRGHLVGEYKSEYEDYATFFTQLRESDHQSHFIVISQEKSKEMERLDNDLSSLKCLELSGLQTVEIISHLGLTSQDNELKLLNVYEGNPFHLETISHSIKNIFDGDIEEFFSENSDSGNIFPVITHDIKLRLEAVFQRLSPLEQEIILKLSETEHLLGREDLKISLNLSSSDLINCLESLQKRYLIKKIKGEKTVFQLSSVFKEYVKSYYCSGK